MSPVAIAFEIFSCHKCTYSQLWLKKIPEDLSLCLGLFKKSQALKKLPKSRLLPEKAQLFRN